jgi:hypothetical protein
MPYFIYVGKILEDLRVEVAVGVGKEADAGHGGIVMIILEKTKVQ